MSLITPPVQIITSTTNLDETSIFDPRILPTSFSPGTHQYVGVAYPPRGTIFSPNISTTPNTVVNRDTGIFTTSPLSYEYDPPQRHVIPRERYPVLYSRKDNLVSIHRSQQTNRRYTLLIKGHVLQNFDYLDTIFQRSDPDSRNNDIWGIHEPNPIQPYVYTYHFRKLDYCTQELLINNTPSLIIRKDEGTFNNLGYVREYTLVQIHPTSNSRTEKLKRLFLRHLGFDCTRQGNKLCIKYSSDNIIQIPIGEGIALRKTLSVPLSTSKIRSTAGIGAVLLK